MNVTNVLTRTGAWDKFTYRCDAFGKKVRFYELCGSEEAARECICDEVRLKARVVDTKAGFNQTVLMKIGSTLQLITQEEFCKQLNEMLRIDPGSIFELEKDTRLNR